MIDIDRLRVLLDAIKGLLIGTLICFIISMCTSSCSVKKKVIDERLNITDSLVIKDSTRVDSVINIGKEYSYSSVTVIDTDEVIEYYSAPDTLGKQWITHKVTRKSGVKKEENVTEKDTTKVSVSTTNTSELDNVTKVSKTKVTTQEKKSFTMWRILLVVGILSMICGAVAFLLKKFF